MISFVRLYLQRRSYGRSVRNSAAEAAYAMHYQRKVPSTRGYHWLQTSPPFWWNVFLAITATRKGILWRVAYLLHEPRRFSP